MSTRLEKDARDFLKEIDGIRDLAPGGMWPGKSPPNKRGSRLILRDVSSERQYSLENEVGVADKTLQVDCYADQPDKAEELFQKIRNRLSGYRGAFGSSSVNGTRIISEGASEEEPENSSDIWTHRYTADFAMFYTQTVPTHT